MSIDPLGSQDIDDALSAKQLPNGNIQIGVRILIDALTPTAPHPIASPRLPSPESLTHTFRWSFSTFVSLPLPQVSVLLFHLLTIILPIFPSLRTDIADVTAFVKFGSLLDVEAKSRATSVYLADRKIDMLPTILSESEYH